MPAIEFATGPRLKYLKSAAAALPPTAPAMIWMTRFKKKTFMRSLPRAPGSGLRLTHPRPARLDTPMRPWSEEMSKAVLRLHFRLRVPSQQGILSNHLIYLVFLPFDSGILIEGAARCAVESGGEDLICSPRAQRCRTVRSRRRGWHAGNAMCRPK